MTRDIASILDGWDYEPDEVQVRIVSGRDGLEKLQMRLDLGLIQMEMDGRPDGVRPSGAESLLDHHEDQVRRAGAEDYALDPAACSALMREGLQYYHRYMAAFHLQRYDLVARDTARNLRLFAFVVRHAARANDKVQFDRYRPYVLMMHARALGLQALAREDHSGALAAIDEGIEGIRAFLRDYDEAENEADCAELASLLRWRLEVEGDKPVGPVERLEQQLKLAVALEEFEEAARLRDQILRLRGEGAAPQR